jgi:hypothetical protein
MPTEFPTGTFSMRFVVTACVLALPALTSAADEGGDAFQGVGAEYASTARPLLEKYCTSCHATDEPKGELDLERFATLADVRKGTDAWLKVAEQLDDGQMPPKDADQPTAAEKARLRGWVATYLDAEARASEGDPGPVILRRLTNAEYGYTVRDLTGVDMDPAREFPADGAAGEGFTNAGNALVMSPALVAKYLDAGKEIARHAVLLPDGFRFSPATTRRDATEELLAAIKGLYARYAAPHGGSRVNLQGIVFETNDGGRLPVERYLTALLEERDALAANRTTTEVIAKARGLSPKYLASLRNLLTGGEPSPLLDGIRSSWKTARPADVPAIVADIARWQNALTRFQSVGHMKPWMVHVDPLTARQEVRVKLAPPEGAKEVVLTLAAGDAGDGNAGDFVIWEKPRFVVPGRPDLLLRDVRSFTRVAEARREQLFAAAVPSLAAAAESIHGSGEPDVAELAKRHGVEPDLLAVWFGYLGLGGGASMKLDHLASPVKNVGGYEFVSGWATGELPSLIANSSDTHVRVPGNMTPHAVAVHPTPTLAAAVGWRSPIDGHVRVDAVVTHAHPECGNGVTWALELRRGSQRRRLAAGVSAGATPVPVGPIESLKVRPGDLLSLLIGPRDGNHSCDLTDVALNIKATEQTAREWSLTRDVSGDVLAGNPHRDQYDHADVWHFYSEPVGGGDSRSAAPDGSALARWQAAESDADRTAAAEAFGRLLRDGPPADVNHPDSVLYRQLASLGGPLLASVKVQPIAEETAKSAGEEWGLDPASFGQHPDGSAIDDASLCVQAPAVVKVRLPADLVAGTEFVASGVLHPASMAEGSVQLIATAGDAQAPPGLRPDLPVLVGEAGPARQRFERGFAEFRNWFPAALCYAQIVPVDEVITLTQFHREDEPLSRLMLDKAETAKIDRLWEELRWVSQDALTQVDAYAQLLEYASQDADPRVFFPYRKPIEERAASYRQALLDAEPKQLDKLVEFAALAWRHPLSDSEAAELRATYGKLRGEGLTHEEAFRLTLARLFISPDFLYRLEEAPAGREAAPVNDWELATRLSYFLWSSVPDDQLRDAAAVGRLRDPDAAAAQAKRMLGDAKVRRLATEFACQWVQVYDFAAHDEKSERQFPEFAAIRGDLYEEAIRYFEDLFRRDGSVLEAFDSDHVIVNGPLAKHYGIPGVEGPEWRRVEGARQYGRGGLLSLGATLSKQSGASRTSPTLRGNWVSEVLFGEKLPKPPAGVPPLPDDGSADETASVREMFERHAEDPACAKCHERIDPLGFSLEAYDAIGRRRDKDPAGRPIDARAKLRDGTTFDGLDGLKRYVLEARREAVLRQFCKKLLGYALGRGVRLSDEPLLAEMRRRLEADGYKFSAAVDAIVRSPQFREIRGRDAELAGAN